MASVQFPHPDFVDEAGKHTGEHVTKTAHDQVILTGVLGGRHSDTMVNIHCQSGPAQLRYLWIIDGTEGTIEVKHRPENGTSGCFVNFSDMDILLNGEEVALDTREEDRLGNTGKAWLEFAKGEKGNFETLEHAVNIYRVLDAAMTSIRDGRRVKID